MIGGKNRADQCKAYREYVENELKEGLMTNPWEGLEGQVLLGGIWNSWSG